MSIVRACLLVVVTAAAVLAPRAGLGQPVVPVDEPSSAAGAGRRRSIEPPSVSASAWLDAAPLVARQGEPVDRLSVRRARLGASGDLGSRLRYAVSAELTTPAFRGASLTWRVTDHLSVRTGRANAIATLERGTSPLDLELMGRSPVSGELTSPPTLGVSVFGTVPRAAWLEYALNATRGRGFSWTDEERSDDVSGRIAIAPRRTPGLLLVLSGARGRRDGGARTLSGLGLDYRAGRWHVLAEGLHEQRDGRGDRTGYVALAAYGFPSRVRPDLARVELAVRLSSLHDREPASPVGPGTGHVESLLTAPAPTTARALQAGVNYYLTPRIRLMGNVVSPLERRPAAPTILVRWQIRL